MKDSEVAVVGDIGGTNARFAKVCLEDGTFLSVTQMACDEFDSFESLLLSYCQQEAIEAGCRVSIAFAGPIHNESVQLTNRSWVIRKQDISDRFELGEFNMLNDFVAAALAIDRLGPEHMEVLGEGDADLNRPRLVLGPGTGLGMAVLVPSNGRSPAFSTEGGHVDFAPTSELEVAVQGILAARFERVSVERIVSGPGLLNLYQAMAEIRQMPAVAVRPDQVTTAALKHRDALATEALSLFCQILGRVSGNAALTLGSAGGVYLCGDMIRHLLPFLHQSGFREAFNDKGRLRPMMEQMPVFAVTEKTIGLLGAAEALKRKAQ